MIQVEPIGGFRLEADPQSSGAFSEPDVTVTLEVSGLRAVSSLSWYLIEPDQVAQFFREIDRDWRGWPGHKRFATFENVLTLTATHDGRGHVELWVDVWDQRPSYATSRASARYAVDVGTAGDIADALDRWVTAVLRERSSDA